ncbi:MAG: preprotein translocase subunit SecG [Deltaproteobacteria bacterium]|nr:preprotein translocase subunit SecG [Deltaproteobacteria bacterium]
MLTAIILIVHVIVCFALILIILLQTGKGADIGAVFGGGSSQTVFGSTGAATFLSKVTITAAVVFMVTSFVLTYFSGRGLVVQDHSVMTEQTVPISAPIVPSSDSATPGKDQSAPINSNEQSGNTGEKSSGNPSSNPGTGEDAK